MEKIINFGKTWSFSPKNIAYPTSASEISEIVKNAKKVRTMGSRHSWSKGIVSEDTLVSLDKMCQLGTVNKATNQVVVQAGITLKETIAQLEIQGYAFYNLGSINAQSIAGAISTATHGTGLGFQCLASQVESLKLIDGEGNNREFTKNDEAFNAIVTGFGSFGIVYEYLLNVVPCFQMHAITDNTTFDDLIENLDSYVKGYDHFKFWWLKPNDNVIIFKYNRTNEPRNDSDFGRWFNDEFVGVIAFRSFLALEKLSRKLVPTLNNILTKTAGKLFDRICKSYVGFLTPVPPVHRETEWAFDYANAQQILKDYKEMLMNDGYEYSFVQEIRFTQADNFWLSPAYGRDSLWLSMYNVDSVANYDDQLMRFEKFARANGGRPHWGKEATLNAQYLNTQFEKIGQFQTLMKELDPQEKFVNNWIKKIFL